jgi:hypothetical protein
MLLRKLMKGLEGAKAWTWGLLKIVGGPAPAFPLLYDGGCVANPPDDHHSRPLGISFFSN